jgi:hypothetical protein
MKTQKTIATLLCATTILGACSKAQHIDPSRVNISDLSGAIESDSSFLSSPLASSIEDIATPSACERLHALKNEPSSDLLAAKFSYLSELSFDKKGTKAALEIDQSPFTQLFLGEKFQVDDAETFYKKAKAEREAGNIGWMKMAMVNMAKFFGLLKKVQYSATNDKLEEAFPGIFGEAMPAENSLHWKIAQRAADFRTISNKELSETLTAKLSLFPGNGSWQDYASETRTSLAAAAKAYKGDNQKERLCALVLMQQNFAQLLRVKGHNAPISLSPHRGKNLGRIEKLASSNPEFQKREVPGAFFDVLAKKSVVVENESIKGYDPSQKRLGVIAQVPNGSTSYEAGKLSDALSLMESLLHSYEATSPAASWLKADGDYLLGDVLSSKTAILPEEAHALALGLLTVHFKNLAALHIKKVDANGKDAQLGGMTAGILLSSDTKSANVYQLKLGDVMRFARVVFYLDHALKQFGKKPINDWKKLNLAYDPITLASLLGTTVYPEAQLKEAFVGEESLKAVSESCKDSERNSNVNFEECYGQAIKAREAALEHLVRGNEGKGTSLRDNLYALKMPIAKLLAQLGTSRAGCVNEMEWDALTGNRVSGSACSLERKSELADLFEIMARDMRAPVLLKKAKELRQ